MLGFPSAPLCIEYSYCISSSSLINYLPPHAFITECGNGETTSDHIFGLQVLEFDPWSQTLAGQMDIPDHLPPFFQRQRVWAGEIW